MHVSVPAGPFSTEEISKAGTQSSTRWVLAVALLLRLPAFWIAMTRYAPTWFFSRGIEMGLLANNLLAGKGLSSPFGDAMGPTGPTAFIAPGYPVLVAGVFRAFGSFTPASEAVLLSLHIALNLLTIWLIMDLCRTLAGNGAAILGGLFWACSPPLLWLPTIFWETSISIFLLIGLVWVALRCKRDPSPGMWAGIGAGCGLMLLFNPALWPTVAVILLWLAWKTRTGNRLGPVLGALTLLILFSPWPIRNAMVFHKFIPLRTTVGFELWMGNREGASGYLEEPLFPMYNMQELTGYIAQGEVAYSQGKTDAAVAAVSRHPWTFVGLTLKRVARFWMGTGTRGGSIFFVLHACITTLLGGLGLCMLWRRNREAAVLFALPLLVFPLPYYITHAEFRYRLVIDALMAVLAAYALASPRRHRERLAAQAENG